MFFDPIYLLFVLPGFILSLFATCYVKSTFAKYAQVPSARRLTGAEAAARMLEQAGVGNVTIEQANGFLSDHYDPLHRTLRLSPDVYDSYSLSAIGVACHEAGHALQHAHGSAMMGLRSALAPVTNIGSSLSYIFFLLGLLMHNPRLILLGVILFSVGVLFALITLPVEWDASARAKACMVRYGIVTPAEAGDAGRVLNAAFLTYLATAVMAVLELLYHLWRVGVFGGRRDE